MPENPTSVSVPDVDPLLEVVGRFFIACECAWARAFRYSGGMIEGPRAARAEELPAVVDLSNGVFSPDGAADMGRMFPLLFAETNVRNLRVFVDEGRPVALSGMTVQDLAMGGVVARAACIGSVCTREEYRGRGLAARLVEDCMSAAAAQGACLVLISGRRGLYRRMGCIDAGLFTVIRVQRNSRLPPVSCSVSGWTESDVPELETLHREEKVRFVRAPKEMLRLLRTGSLHARPGRTWVVRVGGRTAAYLCVSGPGVLRNAWTSRSRPLMRRQWILPGRSAAPAGPQGCTAC